MTPSSPTRRSSDLDHGAGQPSFGAREIGCVGQFEIHLVARHDLDLRSGGERHRCVVRKFPRRVGATRECLDQRVVTKALRRLDAKQRSEEHTSELQSLMRISYAVFCLKKKK